MKNTIFFSLLLVLFLIGCEKTETEVSFENLQELMQHHNYNEADEVIACAGNNRDSDSVSVFFYPEEGAANFRYFEASVDLDGNVYSNYNEIDLHHELLLNRYLMAFRRGGDTEAWGIVTFMLNGKLHASNPIRFKQLHKKTEYNDSLLTIDFTNATSPKFVWEDGQIKENEIFYEIVMDKNQEVLSATYTYDKEYRYYDVSNVVLNLTNPSPPKEIENGEEYMVAIMGVSIDNWINLFIEKPFKVPSNSL